MTTPKTAAIMPTLAGPEWDRFLPSVLTQSRPADEVIVVVDRPVSEFDAQALAKKWPQVTFIFNKQNLGITRSLNVAIHATDADIIFRVDDDDDCLPARFEKQLECFSREGVQFVSSWAEGVADGKPYIIQCPVHDSEIKIALLSRNVLVHPTLAFDRRAVVALGGYDETFVNSQDYALYLHGVRAGYRFAVIPEPLVRRYYNSGTITVSRRTNQIMYSCAVRIIHHASIGDVPAFLRTISKYALLVAIPHKIRVWRRRIFSMLGRGA